MVPAAAILLECTWAAASSWAFATSGARPLVARSWLTIRKISARAFAHTPPLVGTVVVVVVAGGRVVVVVAGRTVEVVVAVGGGWGGGTDDCPPPLPICTFVLVPTSTPLSNRRAR